MRVAAVKMNTRLRLRDLDCPNRAPGLRVRSSGVMSAYAPLL